MPPARRRVAARPAQVRRLPLLLSIAAGGSTQRERAVLQWFICRRRSSGGGEAPGCDALMMSTVVRPAMMQRLDIRKIPVIEIELFELHRRKAAGQARVPQDWLEVHTIANFNH